MFFQSGLFTSESVSPGHPDKICDQVSDAILDAFLELDPDSRVACETFAADRKIILAGEFRTADKAHFNQVRESAVRIVRDTLRRIGYGSEALDVDPDSCDVEVRFNHQSPEIAGGVDRNDGALGAGDQGMMFGYATDETEHHMPLSLTRAHELLVRGREIADHQGVPLRPDAKSQVTVAYSNGRPVGIRGVVLSWQHDAALSLVALREFLEREVLDEVIPQDTRTADFRAWLNPAGAWTIGGPKGDTGLTGRKIIVDTYGGACPHGGGAFSGKDPSKVDRSGAYAARHVAQHVVAGGYARRCTVQLSYAIGESEPVSVSLDLHGTGSVEEERLISVIRQIFDLTPAGIIRELNLKRPIYGDTACFGHFGAWRDPDLYRWESLHRLEDLADALAR